MKDHLVALLAHPPLSAFEFGCAVEIFGLPRPEVADIWYDFGVAAVTPGEIAGIGGHFSVQAMHGLELFERAGTIVIPYWGLDVPVPSELILELKRASARGARILSICSGAFVIAETGLLDGRRATTHWLYTDVFKRRFPRVQLDPDVLYVDEGNVITSAGSAAGLDMMLHVIRGDHGSKICNLIARRINIPPHRDGGQSQFVARPVPSIEDTRLSKLIDWMRRHSTEDLSIGTLANMAAMSPRTFFRRFRSATGLTPYDWLLQERIGIAKELLEGSTLNIDQVASEAGFGAAETLRLHFRRVVGTSPSQYRQMFMDRSQLRKAAS